MIREDLATLILSKTGAVDDAMLPRIYAELDSAVTLVGKQAIDGALGDDVRRALETDVVTETLSAGSASLESLAHGSESLLIQVPFVRVSHANAYRGNLHWIADRDLSYRKNEEGIHYYTVEGIKIFTFGPTELTGTLTITGYKLPDPDNVPNILVPFVTSEVQNRLNAGVKANG
jgi:hypothetical protein